MTATITEQTQVNGLDEFHDGLEVLRATHARPTRAAHIRHLAAVSDQIVRALTGYGVTDTASDPFTWWETSALLMHMAAALEGFRLEPANPDDQDRWARQAWQDLAETRTPGEWAAAWNAYSSSATAEFDRADELAHEPISERRRTALGRACEVSAAVLAGWAGEGDLAWS